MNFHEIPVVVYLSRFQDKDSQQLFSRFVESYLAHPAGWAHDLVIIKKGYEQHEEDWKKRIALLGDVPKTIITLPDTGFDIGSYRAPLEQYPDRYILVMNSQSEILVDHWLDYFMRHAHKNRILGATGSLDTVRWVWAYFTSTSTDGEQPWATIRFRRQPGKWLIRSLMNLVKFSMNYARKPLMSENIGTLNNPFSPFPFPNLRTTALLLPPKILETIEWPHSNEFGVKMATYIFESGYRGLTGQVLSKGMELYVIGSDGRATPINKGFLAETCYSGDQKI